MRRALLAALGLALGCAEADPLPQAILHLRTTFGADELDAVRVRLRRDGAITAEAEIARAGDGPELGSLGLAAADDVDPGAPFTVEITGRRAGADVLTVAQDSPGLPAVGSRQHFACLAARCLEAPACGADEVCSATGCVPREWPRHDAPSADWQACLPSPPTPTPTPETDPDVAILPALATLPVGGPGAQSVEAALTTPSGVTVVAGALSGPTTIGDERVTPQGTDGFVAGLGPDGAARWAWHLTSADDVHVAGVARDVAGRLWVATDFSGTVRLVAGGVTRAERTSGGQGDLLLFELTEAGELGEVRTLGGPGDQRAAGVDAEDHTVVVVGRSVGTPSVPPTCAFVPAGVEAATGIDEDGLVWASRADLPCLWVLGLGGPGRQRADAVRAHAGTIYVAGRYADEAWAVPSRRAPFSLPAPTDEDAFVVTVHGTGHATGAFALGGPGDDAVLSVDADRDGAVLVAGAFGPGARTLRRGDDAVVVGGASRRLLAVAFDRPSLAVGFSFDAADAEASGLAARARLRPLGGVAVGVTFAGALVLPDGARLQTLDAGSDPALVRFDDDAVAGWVHLAGAGEDELRALTVAPDGAALLGGRYADTLGADWPAADGTDGFLLRAP